MSKTFFRLSSCDRHTKLFWQTRRLHYRLGNFHYLCGAGILPAPIQNPVLTLAAEMPTLRIALLGFFSIAF